MVRWRVYRTSAAAALLGCVASGAAAAAATEPIAELTLHGQPSQAKWVPNKSPLFGEYLASGDGSASGALIGKLAWDLYEDTPSVDRHPAYVRGFVERDGQRYPFEIIGLYTAEAAQQWRITGAITFADTRVLGMKQASLTGSFDPGTRTAHYMIWADHEAR